MGSDDHTTCMTSDSVLQRYRPGARLAPKQNDVVRKLEKLGRRLRRYFAPSVEYLHCPKCHWKCSRPSKRRSVFDLVFALFLLHPFRCRSCNRRFYRVAVNVTR
jgi:hypothetical protein